MEIMHRKSYAVEPKYYKISNFDDVLHNMKYFFPGNDNVQRAFKKFYSGEIERYENNPEIFEKFRKNGSSLEGFWIHKRYGTGYFDSVNKRYTDSFFQFFIGRNERDGAVASFEPLEGALLMTQIQGFKKEKEIWSEINYPKFFISYMENFARENGIPEIFVLPYFRNRYEEVRKNRHGESRKYDVSAKQLGFEMDWERGVLFKKLN